jgi:thioredoxin reductase (NADPH)
MNDIEIAIVGAGPAGLSAALYGARFCRSTVIFHDGMSRAARIPRTYNVPGYVDGVSGPDLIERMWAHAQRYGADQIETHINGVEKRRDVFHLTSDDGHRWTARSLILATGVELNEIPIDHDIHEAAIAEGVVRYCPICDGYEHRHMRIAVVGLSTSGAAEALFVQNFSDDVTLLPSQSVELTQSERGDLKRAGIVVVTEPVAEYWPKKTEIIVKFKSYKEPMQFDVLYPALGSDPRNQLAAELGLFLNYDGKVAAHAPLGTEIPGLFCAGDLVEGLDQISVAIGHGAVAATRAHNWLRKCDGETAQAVMQSGTKPRAQG